jgi:hypothetical protein
LLAVVKQRQFSFPFFLVSSLLRILFIYTSTISYDYMLSVSLSPGCSLLVCVFWSVLSC